MISAGEEDTSWGEDCEQASTPTAGEGHGPRDHAPANATEVYCIASFISNASGGETSSFCGMSEGAVSSEATGLRGPGPTAAEPAKGSASLEPLEQALQHAAPGSDINEVDKEPQVAVPAEAAHAASREEDVPPVFARLSGRSGKFYTIEVTGRELPTQMVHRRYSEFVELDKQVRLKLSGLPTLPRKSVFSKHFKPGFMAQREEGLEAFMEAIVEADPTLQDPSVRAFVDPQVQRFGAREAASQVASTVGSFIESSS